MSQFNEDKLHINFIPPANSFGPVLGRKYTLTHSDETGELFLTIGKRYALEEVNPKLRDEVIAEWQMHGGEYMLMAKVHISTGDYDEQTSKKRAEIFKRELPTALTAISVGDKPYFIHFPWLIDCPIFVFFESIYKELNEVVYYGTPRTYINQLQRKSEKTQAYTRALKKSIRTPFVRVAG